MCQSIFPAIRWQPYMGPNQEWLGLHLNPECAKACSPSQTKAVRRLLLNRIMCRIDTERRKIPGEKWLLVGESLILYQISFETEPVTRALQLDQEPLLQEEFLYKLTAPSRRVDAGISQLLFWRFNIWLQEAETLLNELRMKNA